VNALLLSLIIAGANPAEAGWSDFASAFPELPCHDGWAGCLVDDAAVAADMQVGGQGIYRPSGLRLDWFSLQAAPSFSPFVGLSDYPTEVEKPPEKVASRPPPDRASLEEVVEAGQESGLREPPDRAEREEEEEEPIVAEVEPEEEPEEQPVKQRERPEKQREHTSAKGNQAGEQATSYQEPEPEPEPVEKVRSKPEKQEPEPVQEIKTGTSGDGVVVADVAVEEDASCDDLVTLEPAALMGTLSVGQRDCLEARITSASRQTEKDKVSRVLLMDAEARGDKKGWARLIKRHLEDIDRSDPDLCFKYSIYLSRRGVGRAHGVIRWADYALENKSQWQGSTYVSRVYALMKLKAEAANRVWTAAEEAYVADRTKENEDKARKYRNLTKVYAREWLDYARASGQEVKNALALCVSAAGNKAYCEGG